MQCARLAYVPTSWTRASVKCANLYTYIIIIPIIDCTAKIKILFVLEILFTYFRLLHPYGIERYYTPLALAGPNVIISAWNSTLARYHDSDLGEWNECVRPRFVSDNISYRFIN